MLPQERPGKQLWEIGIPNRNGSEFLHGEHYADPTISLKYPTLFPNDVNYVIGQSDFRKDWFFQHIPHTDDLNARVHMEELIVWERWITDGRIPTISLQDRFFDHNNVRWYDWVASFMHAAHFAVPVAFGFVIWIANRVLYWRYVAAVVSLFFAGFITHYIYPAAPPWMAYNEGLLPEVHRVLGSTLSRLSTGDGLNLAYQNFSPNAPAYCCCQPASSVAGGHMS